MNAEIIKAMNKKKKKNTFREWWNKNSYKVYRVIFFPIWIAAITIDNISILAKSGAKKEQKKFLIIISLAEPTGTPKIKLSTSLIMVWAGASSLKNTSKSKTADGGISTGDGLVEKFVTIY